MHPRLLLSLTTGLLLTLNVSGQNLWSNPSSWPSGSVPTAGQQVTIPMGQTIILDVNPPSLSGIRIMGTLRFAEVPLHLKSDWIMVMSGGHLEIGTETAPHMNPARITLTGPDVDVMGLGMGGKFIVAMNGGQIDLHGISRDELSWSVLDGNVNPGSTQLRLRDESTWEAGDKIVLAPSGSNPNEAEELTVTSSSGRIVNFSPALQYRHFGRIQMIDGKQLDMRAEVGLLTRNIVIEGDASSEESAFGGHLMIMGGGNAYIEGVEFFRMGQFTKQGRYPCHWHLSGTPDNNYSRYNSVHHSFHRGMVIHGTDGITLQGNVIYDIRSHGYVLAEDGDEEDNIILDNLGILIRQIVRQEDYAFFNISITGNSSQSESRPGVFWMKNPNQIMRGNHAAGSMDGIGFFFDGLGTATSVQPGFFQDNIAHSNYSYFITTVNERYPPLTRGHGLFMRTETLPNMSFEFEGLTAYKNSVSGVWLEEYGQVATGAMLADNGSGAMLMRAALVNSTVVYQSDNTISPAAKHYGAINTIPTFGKKKDHLIENVAFHGFPSPILHYEDSLAGPNVVARNIQVYNSTGPRVKFENGNLMEGAIRDEDGSLTGSGPSLIFHETYDMAEPSCVSDPSNFSLTCPIDDYVFVRVWSEYGGAKPIGEIEAQGRGQRRTMFYTYESPEAYEQYQYLPINQRYRLNFIAPPLGLLPSLFKLQVKATATGYIALRIQLDAGYGAYVLDENDEFLPLSNASGQLRMDQNNYYVDPYDHAVYVVLKQDAANNYTQQISIVQVPASIFLREQIEPEREIFVTAMPNVVQDATTVRIYQPTEGPVSVRVFDLTGREASSWNPGVLPSGTQDYTMDVSSLPTGTYVLQLESSGKTTNSRLVIAR